MHDETEATRWRRVAELQEVSDLAQRAAYRTGEMAVLKEKAILQQNRREVAEWARTVLGDKNALFLALATTGLHDPVDVVEVVVLDTDGGVFFSQRVRPAAHEGGGPVEVESGASDMHGHTAASLADAPTFSEIHPRLLQALANERVIVYNAEYAERVLSQTLERYDLEPVPVDFECAMVAQARVVGDWVVETGSYSYAPLPGRDGTPEGNALALRDLLRELAGADAVSGAGHGDVDIEETDFESIPY